MSGHPAPTDPGTAGDLHRVVLALEWQALRLPRWAFRRRARVGRQVAALRRQMAGVERG